jgi:hypothetical protein
LTVAVALHNRLIHVRSPISFSGQSDIFSVIGLTA